MPRVGEWCPLFSGVWGQAHTEFQGFAGEGAHFCRANAERHFARGGADTERGRGGHVWEGVVGVVSGSQPPRLLLQQGSKSVGFHLPYVLLCEKEILTFQSRKRH